MGIQELKELREEVRRVHGSVTARHRERRNLYARVRAYYLLRRKEEATQEEIARELGIPVATLYRWIRAYWKAPARSILDQIAEKGPRSTGEP